jgi:hypothetical protein
MDWNLEHTLLKTGVKQGYQGRIIEEKKKENQGGFQTISSPRRDQCGERICATLSLIHFYIRSGPCTVQ